MLHKGNQCSLLAKFEVICVCFPSPWETTILLDWVTALSPSFPPPSPAHSTSSLHPPDKHPKLGRSHSLFSHVFLGERDGQRQSDSLTAPSDTTASYMHQRTPSSSIRRGGLRHKWHSIKHLTLLSPPLPPRKTQAKPSGGKKEPQKGGLLEGRVGMVGC